MDRQVLDRAPRLRACIHAAGTVKKHLDPVVIERGVAGASAALANAVPGAEHSIAALTLGPRQAFVRAWAAISANDPRSGINQRLCPLTRGTSFMTWPSMSLVRSFGEYCLPSKTHTSGRARSLIQFARPRK
ncbi:hypothetical protein ACQEVC_24130 [Plantactinospora sp. CA-294935]|uniref:hypothetical protein n=1 Tax=Plantactinospora sp. CA-294935 TaxID=3240012 RepID=UPI003D926F12